MHALSRKGEVDSYHFFSAAADHFHKQYGQPEKPTGVRRIGVLEIVLGALLSRPMNYERYPPWRKMAEVPYSNMVGKQERLPLILSRALRSNASSSRSTHEDGGRPSEAGDGGS